MSWTKERYQRLLVAIYDTTPKLDWDRIYDQMNDGTSVTATKAHLRGLRRASKASPTKSGVRTKKAAAKSTQKNKAQQAQSEAVLEPKIQDEDCEPATIKEKIEDAAAEIVPIKTEKVEDVDFVMQDLEEV